MHKKRFRKFGASLAIALGLILPSTVHAQSELVGEVIAIQGTVEVQIAQPGSPAGTQEGQVRTVSYGPWQRVQPRQAVHATDQFRTSRKSRLKILFLDKSLIALGPNSTMSVQSYLFKEDDKLRQSVINMVHGLSMFIINKTQTNPKSSFKILTPTGSLAARGSKGFLSVAALKTILAAQAGFFQAQNIDPKVEGKVTVGPMMQTTILKGMPPTPPQPVTPGMLDQIDKRLFGWTLSRLLEKKEDLEPVEDWTEDDLGTEDDYRRFFDVFDDVLAESCTVNP